MLCLKSLKVDDVFGFHADSDPACQAWVFPMTLFDSATATSNTRPSMRHLFMRILAPQHTVIMHISEKKPMLEPLALRTTHDFTDADCASRNSYLTLPFMADGYHLQKATKIRFRGYMDLSALSSNGYRAQVKSPVTVLDTGSQCEMAAWAGVP
ncbi:LOW QUALITY PROTEIN: hypothetical protein ACG7TL_005773 [Trametes sanguinea]